ncbi:MAG: type II secretion system F family protein, partial [Acidobacteriota bacterium]
MESKLLFLLVCVVVLAALAAVAAVAVAREHDRASKLNARMQEAIAPASRPTQAVVEDVSLVRNVSRVDQLKARAAGFLGIDLQQAETYPLKWWAVLPLGVVLDAGFVFLLSHPLSDYAFLLYVTEYFLSPVFWYLIVRFIFNMFRNRRNTKLIQQFPDALNTVVRCVRVGIPMAEALRT